MSVPTIEVEELTKFYGRHRGIEEVTFAVAPGEVFGFLGPNGAGKTTTIRALLDLHHPTGGSARLFGLDSRRDSVAIRARLGNLPGDFGFGRQASGREALRLLARLRGVEGVGRAEALAECFHADLERPLVAEERERGCERSPRSASSRSSTVAPASRSRATSTTC